MWELWGRIVFKPSKFDQERSLVERDGMDSFFGNSFQPSHIWPQDRRYFNRPIWLLEIFQDGHYGSSNSQAGLIGHRKVQRVSCVVDPSVSLLKIRFAQHPHDVDAGPKSLKDHSIIACS